MKRKELTKPFMIISKWENPLVSVVCTKICQRCNLTNIKHFSNICTTAAQSLRRWTNMVQMLYKCFVSAGKC